MFCQLRDYLAMIRFSHTVFALPFALASSVLAWNQAPFRWLDLVGILSCMVFARSAAMGFNRLVDRHYDAANPRTANRHLPTGKLSVGGVTGFTVLMAALFIAATSLFLLRSPANVWPLRLSVPVLLFISVYSMTKRFTALSHFWLGISLMLTPIAAWIAICGMVDLATPILLGVAVLCWVAGFDILYACQDIEFDRCVGLHSIPARLGILGALRLALLCHSLMLMVLVGLWWWHPALNALFLVGLFALGILLFYQHALVRPDDLSRVNQAFFQVNALISVGMLVIVCGDVWWI